MRHIVRRTIFVDFIVRCTYKGDVRGPGPPGNRFTPAVWERTPSMVKVEDIQNYGKEHLESVAASASNLQLSLIHI